MKNEVPEAPNDGSASESPRKPGPLRYLPPVVEVWSVRERLALATAVSQDTDKNWHSISKLVKPFATEKRSDDYFAPRNCARQYANLLEHIEQPKRRGESVLHDCTQEEMLAKRLTLDRIEELQNHVKRIQKEYNRIKKEVEDIKSGDIDNKQLMRMYSELKEKEKLSAPKEELIPISETDIDRLNADTSNPNAEDIAPETINQSLPNKNVIHSSDLGIPAEDGYDDDTARIEECRREVLRVLDGPNKEIKEEVVGETERETTNSGSTQAVQPPAPDSKPVPEPMEIKQEDGGGDANLAMPSKSGTRRRGPSHEELAPPQSPSSSSVSSTPRRSVVHRMLCPVSDVEADAEDDDVDDEATEGEEDEEASRSSLPLNEKSYRTWKKSINMIIRAAQSHKHASVFLSPVTDDIAAGYSQVIYRPMDLSTIKRRVDNGEIRTTAEFQRDVMMMFTNAVMYNNAEHDVHKMALEMYDDVMYHIEQYLSTQVMNTSVESKVLRHRASEHNPDSSETQAMPFRGYNTRRKNSEDEQGGRRRRGSTDSDRRDDAPKKSRK